MTLVFLSHFTFHTLALILPFTTLSLAAKQYNLNIHFRLEDVHKGKKVIHLTSPNLKYFRQKLSSKTSNNA